MFSYTPELSAVYVSSNWGNPKLPDAFKNSKSSEVTQIDNCKVCNLAA